MSKGQNWVNDSLLSSLLGLLFLQNLYVFFAPGHYLTENNDPSSDCVYILLVNEYNCNSSLSDRCIIKERKSIQHSIYQKFTEQYMSCIYAYIFLYYFNVVNSSVELQCLLWVGLEYSSSQTDSIVPDKIASRLQSRTETGTLICTFLHRHFFKVLKRKCTNNSKIWRTLQRNKKIAFLLFI